MTYRIGLSVRARIGREQLQSLANAAAGIDDRNCVVADDEPDIGDGAFVLARHQCGLADMHEYTGRDLADRQRSLLRLRAIDDANVTSSDKDEEAMSHILPPFHQATSLFVPVEDVCVAATYHELHQEIIPVARTK